MSDNMDLAQYFEVRDRERALAQKRVLPPTTLKDRNDAYCKQLMHYISQGETKEEAHRKASEFWDNKCPHLKKHAYPEILDEA